jgi:hypothetical protein
MMYDMIMIMTYYYKIILKYDTAVQLLEDD